MDIANDAFWLLYGKTAIEKSINSRNEAAEKLEKMVLWLWAIYTASFTIGTTINAINAPTPVLILLSLPIITLIITYWMCTWTRMPIAASFDPRIPSEIKEGYNKGLKVKIMRFRWTLFSTLISAITLSAALFSLSFVEKKNAVSMEAFIKDNAIVVSGVMPKNTLVTTTMDSLNAQNQKIPFFTNTYKVQQNEVLNVNLTLKEKPQSAIFVTTMWKVGNEEKALVSIIRPEKKQ